jgi:8-oxo-dGTP pyrophosphatase MutT (NUDIX family)
MVGHNPIIMAAAGAFLFNAEGQVLLQLRADSRTWGHPGGFMELGESVEDTVRREFYEETGLNVKKLDFFGIYSGPSQQKTLVNGDQICLVKMIFTCKEYDGALTEGDEETADLQFFHLQELPHHLFVSQKAEFDDLLSGRKGPFIR